MLGDVLGVTIYVAIAVIGCITIVVATSRFYVSRRGTEEGARLWFKTSIVAFVLFCGGWMFVALYAAVRWIMRQGRQEATSA